MACALFVCSAWAALQVVGNVDAQQASPTSACAEASEGTVADAPYGRVGAAEAAGGARVHIIEAGETLSGISAATDRSVEVLARANGIADVDLIYAGSALVVP